MKFDISVFGYVFTFLFGVLFEHFIRRRERYRERIFDKVTDTVSLMFSDLMNLMEVANILSVNLDNHLAISNFNEKLTKFHASLVIHGVYLPLNVSIVAQKFVKKYDVVASNPAPSPVAMKVIMKDCFEDMGTLTGLLRHEVGMMHLGEDFSTLFMSLSQRVASDLKNYRSKHE